MHGFVDRATEPASNHQDRVGGSNRVGSTDSRWNGVGRSAATGIAANAVAIGGFGIGTAPVPLPTILPQGLPGCTQLTTADSVVFYLPAAGRVTMGITTPDTVALAGVTFHQQVAFLELDPIGNIVAVTSTNRLRTPSGPLSRRSGDRHHENQVRCLQIHRERNGARAHGPRLGYDPP